MHHVRTNIKYLLKPLIEKPKFALRLVRNYIQATINPGRPPIRLVDFAISYKCNMSCEHCSSTPLIDATRQELSLADYSLVGRKLRKAGMLVANITGGEPFVHPQLFDIINVLDPSQLLVAIQTNGIAVTEQKLNEAKKLGVTSIGISIDGPAPNIHDSFRNTVNAFEKALKTLEMASKMGFRVGVSYCLTHEKLYSKEREEMIAICRKFGAILNYNLASPIGFWRGKKEGLISQKDRKFLLQTLKENPDTKTDLETTYFRRGCSAIKEKFYITAYGDVMPCPFIQVSFGNIRTDDIETIRNRAFRYKYFQGYPNHCLAAENKAFIDNTFCYDPDAINLSLPIYHKNAFKNRDIAEWNSN
jgi:MoaA/NifB/PqqE/SkfB family radical SAM enzyme